MEYSVLCTPYYGHDLVCCCWKGEEDEKWHVEINVQGNALAP